ncbi:Undefined function [Listeria monocytogenes]|nr:Undefined function [Listeria monocytogenes]
MFGLNQEVRLCSLYQSRLSYQGIQLVQPVQNMAVLLFFVQLPGNLVK